MPSIPPPSPRGLRLVLAVFVLSQVAWSCPLPSDVRIVAPRRVVDTFAFDVRIEVRDDALPEGFDVELNEESILDRLSVVPGTRGGLVVEGVIQPGAPLRDLNELKAGVLANGSSTTTVSTDQPLGDLLGIFVERATALLEIAEARSGAKPADPRPAPPVSTRHFVYRPPGKAVAKRIVRARDRIRGPLGHSKKGDWLLENGGARFAIQDVGQRELYSVGQYGGNIIDAEVRGNPGKDNFLELQPGLNVESVINAQVVEIVNDGQDGTAAILRTCGPDDLLDFVNPSSQINDLGIPGIRFPALADDRDLEIEACTTYTLEPGDAMHVSVDTEVFNNYTPATLPPGTPDPLPLVVGDWLNPAGELHTVARAAAPPSGVNPASNGVGPPVSSSLGTLGFFGFDEAAGLDYAFAQVPLTQPNGSPGSFAFVSGVLVVLHSQNVLLTLAGLEPVRFTVPMGESRTFTRFFSVGDGSASHAFDLEKRVKDVPAGTVEGCVTVAGEPVAGARVSVGPRLGTGLPASNLASDELAAHFTTGRGACPNFSGLVSPGSFVAAAGLAGHLYQGGAATPPLVALEVAPDATTTLDFDLPAAGALRVHVRDADDRPMPARVTVVGFDPSPEVTSTGPSLPGFGSSAVGLLEDVSDALPFGVAAVGYANAQGIAEFPIEPGTGLYHVYVSRGSEYSAWRTPAPIDVIGGETTELHAQLARVVETPGFVSSDFHVHGIRSADSRVSDIHRVESYAAEGVENVIMTDHHVHTDLRPAIANAGMREFVTATVGEEITSFDYGHFNAYPLQLDPDSPTATFGRVGRGEGAPASGSPGRSERVQLSGGSTDWAQAAPPGEDFPSFGALNATPAEIFALATAGPLAVPGVTTAQINHISSHFEPLRIDTSQVPPADGLNDAQRAGRRLPDTASVPNLYHHYPALELWNGDDTGAQLQFLFQRIGIWFNLLNQGLRTTFIADTDSHTFTNLNSAGARTWTASPTDDARSIDPADVAASVDAGRAIGGQGVFVRTRLLATDGSGAVADLSWSGSTEVTDANGNVELEIHVQSPGWAEWDRVFVYANAPTVPAGSPYLYSAQPTAVLEEGDCNPATTGDGDFDITVTPDVGGVPGAARREALITLPFAGLSEETWFAVTVIGTSGPCAPMFPVYADGLAPGENATLADLVDGNAGQGGTMPLGATNALYFVP